MISSLNFRVDKVLVLSLVALCLVASIALAACSSDPDPTETPQPAPAAPTMAAQPTAAPAPTAAPQPSAPTPAAPTARPAPSTPAPAATTTPAPSAPAATATPSAPAPSGPVLQVVTTTNFVGDWVKNIGGDRVEVFSMLAPGSDPHSYQPGARDVARIADADVVFSIGLSLEAEWLTELIHNASLDDHDVVALGDYIDAIETAETGAHHDDDHDDDHDDGDDHDDEHDDEHGTAMGRLIIADTEQAALSVLDLSTEGLATHRLPVASANPTLYSSPSSRFLFAINRPENEADHRVQIYDGGIYLEAHGDHFDLVYDPVSLMAPGTADPRPIHVAVHNGWTAIYHDGSGRAALFEEHHLEEDYNDYEPVWLDAGLQHGAAVAMGDDTFVVTSNNPDYPATSQSSLPLGAEIRTIDDVVIYDDSNRSCPGMHGEAANHHGVMMGCVGGVLLIESHDGSYEHFFYENPPDMLEEARIGSLWGYDGAHNFFGTASYRSESGFVSDGLWMIYPLGGDFVRVLPSTEEKTVIGTAFDGHGEEFFALTADGILNVINPENGEVEEEIQMLDSIDPEVRPYMIAVGEMIYVSDRANGRVFEFSPEHGEIEREWAIAGMPGRIAFVGITGDEEEEGHDDHDDEDGHDDHDGEDDHGHAHGPLDPHFWFDPVRVKVAIDEILHLLEEADPAGASYYESNATAYKAQLDELHSWSVTQLDQVPVERRYLVTSHDSLSYFAVLYGFEVIGTVIPSISTDVTPSAQEMAHLIEEIDKLGVPAVFGETTVSERLAQTIAQETGTQLVRLYSGSMGEEGSEGDTYIKMVMFNVEQIANALK